MGAVLVASVCMTAWPMRAAVAVRVVVCLWHAKSSGLIAFVVSAPFARSTQRPSTLNSRCRKGDKALGEM